MSLVCLHPRSSGSELGAQEEELLVHKRKDTRLCDQAHPKWRNSTARWRPLTRYMETYVLKGVL